MVKFTHCFYRKGVQYVVDTLLKVQLNTYIICYVDVNNISFKLYHDK